MVAGIVAGTAVLLVTTITPTVADTPVTLPLAVNFQTQTAATPSGYNADYGQAYSATRRFGWITATSTTPLSLVGNGRERNTTADQRRDTFMHMQLPTNTSGVHQEGRWQAAVSNGSYQVTLTVGDPSHTNSHHVIRLEGQKVIDFTPTATTTFLTKTSLISVSDGFLTVDAVGGTNTKLDYLEIASATGPRIVSITPAAGATGVSRNGSLTMQLSQPVNANTMSAGVKVLDSAGNAVAGYYNTDAAGSNITFAAAGQLSANTTYVAQTNGQLKSSSGATYSSYASSFTTDGAAGTASPFNKSTFSSLSGVTALTMSPDNTALYAAINNGSIWKYGIGSNGLPSGNPTEIAAFKNQRLILGLRFDPASTAVSPKLWVSSGQLCQTGCTDFTGSISVLTGISLGTKRDVITGLPRSYKDHMNNGIDFGPDGKLYIAQGSNTGYGAPDSVWGNRPERPLNAAVLVADVKNDTRFQGTVNVNTSTGYNPDASTAPVKIYAQGIRNPFSLVWHSNGKLYAPVNESASGNAPAGPNGSPQALNNLPAYNDYFTQVVPNRYYGHPNPSRNKFVLNGGNPTSGTDPFQVSQYPVGQQPDSGWRKPDLDLGLHQSPDGSVEYKSGAVASLKGKILVTEYSQNKDVIAITIDAAGNAVSKTQVASGLYNPLAITADQSNGCVYVSEYGSDPQGSGGKITLLTPKP